MVDDIALSKSKTLIKRKLFISLIAWGLALAAAAMMSQSWYLNIFLAFVLSVFIVHQEKIPRYWRLSRSNNFEVINAGFSSGQANKLTTLPFRISFFVIILIIVLYILDAVFVSALEKVLLGLCVVISAFNSSRKEIIFDYDHNLFYGLWKTSSLYDSDRQFMKQTIFSKGESDDKIKVTEKDEHYFVYKKDFSEVVWNRILVNMDMINELNTKHE